MLSIPLWNTRSGFRSRKAVLDICSFPGPRRRFSEAVLWNERFLASCFLGNIVFWKRILVVLLLISVLSPIVHFTVNRGFIDDVSSPNQNFGSEDGKLHAVSQESMGALKEPLGIVYIDNSSNSDQILAKSEEDSAELAGQGKSGEHKNGALNSEKEGMIEQVITMKNHRDVLQKPKSAEESKEMGSQQTMTTAPLERKKNKPQRPFKRTSHKVDLEMHPTTITDARVWQLKDQLSRAKIYLELGPTRCHPHFIRELRAQVRDIEGVVRGATKDSELSKDAYEKLKAMEETLSKGKQNLDDCVATEKRLRAIIHSTEEQLRAATKQTQFLTQLVAKTLPIGLHCLPLRLSIEYNSLNSTQQNQFPNQEKLEDPKLYHYALFSDNILAAAVVVNSTLFHAKRPGDHVFHVVTDRLNYAAMRMWFLANLPGKATIQVQKVEEFTWLNASYSPVLNQLGSQSMIDYYFRTRGAKSDGNLKYRNPKYLSILNHLRFYLPEIFPKLNKVVFLDDDIVVQKDLTGLWGIDLKGKVNGAVETCGKSFHRFDKYLNFSNPLIAKNFDPRACGWAFGMNVFDLAEWRKQNITEVYHSWQKLNNDRLLWKLGSLPPGLITFYNRVFSLDRSWHVLGLGYNENVNQKDIDQAAVIHYNGNMKPWLEIGMAKYRDYWSKYVDYGQIYLRECNVII